MGFFEPGKLLKRKSKLARVLKTKKPRQPPSSSLERLPKEILFRIFVYAGIHGNNLALTSKYFHGIFSLRHAPKSTTYWPGKALLVEIIDVHFKYNLNKDMPLVMLKKKLDYYATQIPNSEYNRRLLDARESLDLFKIAKYAIDASLFRYNFVSVDFFNLISKNDAIIMEREMIDEEIQNRHKHTRQMFDSLEEEVKKLNENSRISQDSTSVSPHEAYDLEANTNEANVITSDSNDVSASYSFSLESKLPRFPLRFCKSEFNSDQLGIMDKMFDFGFRLEQKEAFAFNLIDSFKNVDETKEWKSKIDVLLKLIEHELTAKIIIRSFDMFVRAQESERSHYYGICDRLVSSFYLETEHKDQDDEIWHYVLEEKNTQLYDMIIRYAGPPNTRVIASINM